MMRGTLDFLICTVKVQCAVEMKPFTTCVGIMEGKLKTSHKLTLRTYTTGARACSQIATVCPFREYMRWVHVLHAMGRVRE